MDDLPPSLLFEILCRLNNSFDLVRCRLVSKTLNSISYEVPSLKLFCSYDRYLKSRAPETRARVTPFKLVVKKILSSLRSIESVAIGVDSSLQENFDHDDDDDDSDDLYLTSVEFVSEWLPEICGGVKVISVSDFWVQSCWRRSEVLSLISSCCNHLLALELRNAWLSVEGLKPMPMLTSLTLEFVRLDDEDLNKVNDCFPSLCALNLIGVGGLNEPKIHLLNLKTCQWEVSNAPVSLSIDTPNLKELKLKCVKPRVLVLKAPLLSVLHLSMKKAGEVFEVDRFVVLKSLQFESSDLCDLIKLFPNCKTVENLVLDSPKLTQFEPVVKETLHFEKLVGAFPNVSSLTLQPGAWSNLEMHFLIGGLEGRSGWKSLEQLVAHLTVLELEGTLSFISSLFKRCTSLSNVAMLVHRDVSSNVKNHLISSCVGDWPRIKWRWGMWKEGQKDCWVSDGI